MNVHLKSKLLSVPPKNGKFYIIAIDGRGGAGKTMLSKRVADLLPDFVFLNGDDYFEPTPNQVAWGEFNDARFIQDVINPLARGETSIAYQPYDWHSKPNLSEQKLIVSGGVCLERCFSFAFKLDYDLKIWLETPKAVCLERGLARERLPRAQAEKVWNSVWQPREDEYIAHTKPLEIADIVVDGTKLFEAQLK